MTTDLIILDSNFDKIINIKKLIANLKYNQTKLNSYINALIII